MYRLFVAINLPDEVKDRLIALQRAPVPGATWVKREALHLTLRFLGDGIPAEQLDAITGALSQAGVPPFEVTLAGVGKFPPGNQGARVLWAGMKPQPALNRLHGQIEAALAGVGFPPEARPFSAHITLARLKSPPPPAALARFLKQGEGFQTDPIPVTRFILYSSVLTPQGAQYTPQAVYTLQ